MFALHGTAFLVDIITDIHFWLQTMPIEWDALVAEMSLLPAIIYGAVYVETWVQKRKMSMKDRNDARLIAEFVTSDLQKTLHFIDDTIQ